MIPVGTRSSQSAAADRAKERLDMEPTGAGFLAGKLTDPFWLLVISVTLLVLCPVFFVAAYVADDYETPFAHMSESGAGRAFSILAVISLLAGIAYLVLASVASGAKRGVFDEYVSDDDFRTEPRELGLESSPAAGETHYHEVIKVRCRYCGTLNDVTASNCIACGGQL